MRYLHTMLRVRNLDQALDFYCNKLGLKEERRRVDEKNRYTLVFLAAPEDETLVEESKRNGRDAPLVELTYNWDSEDYGEARYFGHLAYEVDDIYAPMREADEGRRDHQPPAPRRRDGVRALARQALDRAAAEGRAAAAQGAVGLHAEHREMVRHTRFRCDGGFLAAGAKRLYMSPRFKRPSSSGLGRRPFTAETRVRFP